MKLIGLKYLVWISEALQYEIVRNFSRCYDIYLVAPHSWIGEAGSLKEAKAITQKHIDLNAPPSPPFPVGGVKDEGKGVLAPQGVV